LKNNINAHWVREGSEIVQKFNTYFLMAPKLLSKPLYLVLGFDKSLTWLVIETNGSKLSIYFYLVIAILCTKMSSVYRT